MTIRLLALVFAIVGAFAPRLVAQELTDTPEPPYALEHTGGLALSAELAATISLFFIGDAIVDDTPGSCPESWCQTNGFDRGVRDLLRAENSLTPAYVSHAFTLGLVPLTGIATLTASAIAHDEGVYAVQDTAILVNVFLATTAITGIVKAEASRQRPAFHYGRGDETEAANHPHEEFSSFYSGDTAWAFSVGTAAVTLAHLRGYPIADELGYAIGAMATIGGVLRIVADMHWATDVLTGALVGSALGFGIPYLIHGRAETGATDVALSPLMIPGVQGVSIGGRW